MDVRIEVSNARYHGQDDATRYCGCASIMMILSEFGLNVINYAQDDLFQTANDYSADNDLYMTPEGLAHTLNLHVPSSKQYHYQPTTNRREAERQIIYSLSNGVPPAVLLYGNHDIAHIKKPSHWIIVVGIIINASLEIEPDPDIVWLKIMNPQAVNLPKGFPCQHFDSCHHGMDNCLSIVKTEEMTYDTWRKYYFRGTTYTAPNQYIVVGGGTPPAFLDLLPQAEPVFTPPEVLPEGFEQLERKKRDQILAELRLKALLKNRDDLPLLREGAAGEPEIIQMTDGGDYSLVPIINEGKYQGIVSILPGDAGISFVVFEKPQATWLLTREEKIKFLSRRLGQPLKNEDVHDDETLVWRDSIESRSRFLPFYRVYLGKRTFFIRLDGEVFETIDLNPRTKGG